MLAQLSISEQDWLQASPSMRTALSTLWQQVARLDARYGVYALEVARLQAQLTTFKALQAEVLELRERLGLNSCNSSKPPSSDLPSQRRRITRAPSGRRIGAQLGHPGHGRQLKPLDQVDHLIDLRPECCLHCGSLLLGEDPDPARHQVSELPRSQPIVIEYRRHSLKCLGYGAANQAPWPEEMPTGSFGPRAQTTVAFLTGRIGERQREVVEVLRTAHGLELSVGTVSAIEQQVSRALEQPVEAAQAYVRRQAVNNIDETSWREGAKHPWRWVNATAQATLFKLLPARSAEAAKQVIGSDYAGVAGTDRDGADNWLGNQHRQICWAHLKREFQRFVDRGGESQQLGEQLLGQVKAWFALWHQWCEGKINRLEFQAAMQPMQRQVGALLRAGAELCEPKTRRTCRNLLKVEAALRTFVEVAGVEPTNNSAERALRRAVIWRRRSFGTKSTTGSQFVERALSAVTTLRQQQREVLDYLTALCASAQINLHTPCLLPVPP